MKELAKQFIDKECIIYTISNDNAGLQGIIREITDGGMRIESKSGEQEIINMDLVVRIREYPKKKNGKKKAFFID